MTIVLFGGPSRERLVSVATAQNVLQNLPEYGTLCWFWAPEGQVHEVARTDILAHREAFTKNFTAHPLKSWLSLTDALDDAKKNHRAPIFNALHGVQGEDGTVQKLCEERAIALTGSNAEASKASFDKNESKRIVAKHKILTAPSLLVTNKEDRHNLSIFLQQHHKIVLKPVCDGSSFGLAIIENQDALGQWLERADWSHSYLAEAFVSGVELTVGVIEYNGSLKALTPVEISPESNRVFDYEGKYLGNGVKEIIPARISPSLEEKAKDLAALTHKAMGLRGYSRTDMIATKDGNLYFLEVNSLPGLTKESLVPKELALAGITMSDFIGSQIKLVSQL